MNINEYQELAMTTLNPELSKRDVLINSVMGLCGESGEAIDKLSVVITLILAVIFLHEDFTVRSAIGAVLITAGTVLMVL